MSIIHEALSKSQQTKPASNPFYFSGESEHNPFWKWLIFSVIVLLGAIFISYYFLSHIKQKHIQPTATVPLVFTGYYIAGNYRLLEINHRFYQPGNMINGMKIISIEPNKIVLQKDGKNMEQKILL
jgi:hypothetical protein